MVKRKNSIQLFNEWEIGLGFQKPTPLQQIEQKLDRIVDHVIGCLTVRVSKEKPSLLEIKPDALGIVFSYLPYGDWDAWGKSCRLMQRMLLPEEVLRATLNSLCDITCVCPPSPRIVRSMMRHYDQYPHLPEKSAPRGILRLGISPLLKTLAEQKAAYLRAETPSQPFQELQIMHIERYAWQRVRPSLKKILAAFLSVFQ